MATTPGIDEATAADTLLSTLLREARSADDGLQLPVQTHAERIAHGASHHLKL